MNYEAIRASSAQVTIRECANAVPIAIATYSFGREKKANLASLS